MKIFTLLVIFMTLIDWSGTKKQTTELKEQIQSNEYFTFTKVKALEIAKTRFNASDSA